MAITGSGTAAFGTGGTVAYANGTAAVSTSANLDRATHGNRRLILTNTIAPVVLDDTAGGWGSGDVLYGVNSGTGVVTLTPDSTGTATTLTAGAGKSLVGYPGQEFILSRDAANSWFGGFDAPEPIVIPITGATEGLSTGTNLAGFYAPFAFRLVGVYAGVFTVSSSGIITFDINDDGTTVMATNKLTIDASENTSATAATPAAITAPTVAANSYVSVDCDGAGTGAGGAAVTLLVIRA